MINDFEQAKKFVEEKKYCEAMNLFLKIKKFSLHDSSLDFEIGKLDLLMNNYEDAIKIFKNILKIQFDYNTAILLAKSYREVNKFKNAIKSLLYVKKQKISVQQDKEVNDLIISFMCHFNHKELAVKFMKKIDNKNTSYDIDNLYNDCLGDMTQKNIKGLSLQQYGKIINDVDDAKLKNAILNEYEIYNKKTTLLSKPRRLRILLTNLCNLKCRMCEVVKNNKQQISNDKMNEIVKLFPYLEDIIWMGGEVFLYPGFMDLVEKASQFNIRQSLSTNGILLNNEIVKKLCDCNVDMTFSIDSINKETYEYIRCGADFNKLIENIKLVNLYNKNKMILTMHYVISKYNCEENLMNVVSFAKKYSFYKLVFIIDTFADSDTYNYIVEKYNKIKKELYIKSVEAGINLISHVPELKKIKNTDNVCIKDNNKESVIRNKTGEVNNCNILESQEFQANIPYCFLPWKMITIDANGITRADCFCPELGNYENESILDIWNNNAFVNLRKNILLNNKVCNATCYNSNRKFY